MRVFLGSSDWLTVKVCRQVVESLQDPSVLLVVERPENITEPMDLYIWDLPGAAFLPAGVCLDHPDQHIFLLHSKDLPVFQQQFSGGAFPILLKPLAAHALRAFLDQAAGRHRSAADGRRELLQFLLEANVKLQEYDQQRTTFLARMAHDFRVPLTAVSGYCDLLLDGQLGLMRPEHTDLLHRMRRSLTRVLQLAEAIFDLSVSDRVERKPHLQEADFSACLKQAILEVAPLIEQKQIGLMVNIGNLRHAMRFDPAQLEQVFINLLDNARKFTPRRGSILFTAYEYFWQAHSTIASDSANQNDDRRGQSHSPNSYRIDIADSGPGIPPSEIENIFEEYTISSTNNDRTGGGLGLAICRLIVSRHNGKIWAESTGYGTRFSVVLPFAIERNEPPVQHPPEIEVSKWRTDGSQLNSTE